jgi:putative ABC transport system substrate-binding protein
VIRRRTLIGTGAVACLTPLLGFAQTTVRSPRIGILYFGDAPGPTPAPEALVDQLRNLGYVEGRNIGYERRYAGGRRDAYAALAAELLQASPAVIYAPGSDIAQAFARQSSQVPVVFTVSDDPVATGLVQTLARPGGRFTGVALMSPELAGKRLELLRDTLPSLRRVAVLHDPGHRATYLEEMKAAARRLAIDWIAIPFSTPADFEPAFERARSAGVDAMFIEPNRFTLVYAQKLGELAIRQRIAAISAYDLFARAGGLMSYGARYEEQAVRAAKLVQRVLNGERPAELPVEQPTRSALVVNLRTARALGLAIPPSLLLRADEVIE